MPTTHHREHPADRTAMLAMRAAVAAQGERSFAPDARAGFDAMIARTPPADGIRYEPGLMGGVPGWWCYPAEVTSDAVILHHHGGAYVMGSAEAFRHYVGQVASRAGMAAFSSDYALAPERPFPAAPRDALAAYRGLAEAGHQRVALVGDSAGGGLALSLMAAVCRTATLPRPLGAMVMSPWVDLALGGASMEDRAEADPLLTRKALDDAARLYLGDHSRCRPDASPLYGDLAGLPPVLIHVGEDEILLEDSVRYASRLSAVGGRADLHVWAGMPHVFPASVGLLRAAAEALDIGGAFLRHVAAGAPGTNRLAS